MSEKIKVIAEKIEQELNHLNRADLQNYSSGELYRHLGETEAYKRVLGWIIREITSGEQYADVQWLIEVKPKKKKSPIYQGAANCLRNGGIRNIGELAHKTEFAVRMTRNLGSLKLDFIKEMLNDCGLTFGMSFEEIEKAYHLPEYARRALYA